MSIEAETTKAQPETVENPDELNQIDHDKTPRCYYHPEKEAESQCDKCERKICGLDMEKSGTIEICNACFIQASEDAEFGNKYVWPLAIGPIAIIVAVFIWLSL